MYASYNHEDLRLSAVKQEDTSPFLLPVFFKLIHSFAVCPFLGNAHVTTSNCQLCGKSIPFPLAPEEVPEQTIIA
jgi:hypothetical protein